MKKSSANLVLTYYALSVQLDRMISYLDKISCQAEAKVSIYLSPYNFMIKHSAYISTSH